MGESDLMAVVYKALKEEEFFKALLKNVDAALERAHISLSKEDTAALKSALQSPPSRIELDLPAFLRGAHKQGLAAFRWVAFRWIDPLNAKPKD